MLAARLINDRSFPDGDDAVAMIERLTAGETDERTPTAWITVRLL